VRRGETHLYLCLLMPQQPQSALPFPCSLNRWRRVLETALWGPVVALVTAVVVATAAHPWRRRGPDHGDGSSASMLLQKLELAGGKIYGSPDAFLGV
jgi:hypothetical protein